jgi:hypothetical protein
VGGSALVTAGDAIGAEGVVLGTLAEHRHLRLVVHLSFDHHALSSHFGASNRGILP